MVDTMSKNKKLRSKTKTEISLWLGVGNGSEIRESTILIKGCECRHDDFVLAIVKFTNDWRKEADKRKPVTEEVAPCGCKEGAK